MIRFCYIFLCLFGAVYFELLAGSYGLMLPITAMLIFYFSVSNGWRVGLFSAVLAGTIIDLTFGRSWFLTPVLLAMTVGFAMIWFRRVEAKSIFLNSIPGAIIAFICICPLLLPDPWFLGLNFTSLFQASSMLLFSMLFAAILLPFLVILLDIASEKLGFELYVDARDKLIGQR